jgi:hypothetical protein
MSARHQVLGVKCFSWVNVQRGKLKHRYFKLLPESSHPGLWLASLVATLSACKVQALSHLGIPKGRLGGLAGQAFCLWHSGYSWRPRGAVTHSALQGHPATNLEHGYLDTVMSQFGGAVHHGRHMI